MIKNKNELDKIFIKSSIPELTELSGEYYVDMLTGLPSLKKLFHRKAFYQKNNLLSTLYL